MSNHIEYGLGVPERVNRLFQMQTKAHSNQQPVEVDSILITCKDTKEREQVEKEPTHPSDFVYFVDFPEEEEEPSPQHFHFKQ